MITIDHQDGVATMHLDDGKANAFNPTSFAAINDALDLLEKDEEVKAIVIAGREGTFSAGLDLKVLPTLDGAGLKDLIRTFATTMLRVFALPKPVIGAATGHALGGGTILSMACDHTVAADGPYRWGLNEVAIGMVVPRWIVAICHSNVPADKLDDLILPGRVLSPEQAVEVGFADEVLPMDEVLPRAAAVAAERAQLVTASYGATKAYLRGDAIERELGRLESELTALFG